MQKHTPRLVGYARVSTDAQDTRLQLDALARAGCTEIVQDQGVSGTVAPGKRPTLSKLLDPETGLQRGDTLVVWKLDRVGRSLRDLVTVLPDLMDRGIGFRSLTETIDTTTAAGTLMFHMFCVFAQFERNVIAERSRAGLKAARERNVKFGRPTKITPELVKAALDAASNLAKHRAQRPDKINLERRFTELAEQASVSVATVWRAYKQGLQEQGRPDDGRHVLSRDLPKESTLVE